MLKSIFYARFHQEKGPKVLHQVPEGSIIPCPPSVTAQTPLFDFQSVSEYIIPRREFCDRLLAVCSHGYRIIGYPVCITDDKKYDRNDFIFNFCVVLEEDGEWSAYASMAKKLARLFRNLEEQTSFLSSEEDRPDLVMAGEEGYGGGAKVYALCEMIMEDLNNYCECMIPLDESNTLSLKLFPTRPPPPPVHAWHVPLSVVRFSSLQTSSWDLTVQRILPYIDGVNSISIIANLADADLGLTRRAVAHLVYYGCVLLLDIFSFSAVYAQSAGIGAFVTDQTMQDECRRYVASPISMFGKDVRQLRLLTSTNASRTTQNIDSAPQDEIPSRGQVLELYLSLRQGLSLRDWCLNHSSRLANVDVRRFITFGIIKGFIYRIHKYALALRPTDLEGKANGPIVTAKQRERAWRKAAMSSGWRVPENEQDKLVWSQSDAVKTDDVDEDRNSGFIVEPSLAKYLDGLHSLDEICTELRVVEKDAVRRLKGLGDVLFVQK